MSPDQQHSGAPTRLVYDPVFREAYDDALERQARLEQSQLKWLREFHDRFGGSPR